MDKKIRRRCKGGCGKITSPGKKYIKGHYWENKKRPKQSKEARLKQSLAMKGKKQSAEHKLKNSLAHIGNMNALGHKQSKEHILKRSLSLIKPNPNYEYGCEWQDKEYRKDLCKDYCENVNCKGKSKRFVNHHIHLNKKRCAPNEIMTLCNSCHSWLHNKLQRKKYKKPTAFPKDYIIINRLDHISYIHKLTRSIIKVERR